MSLPPFRPQAKRSLELFGSVSSLPLIFERQPQLIMRRGIVRIQFERLAIAGNRLLPGFLPSEFASVPTIALGRLRKTTTRNQQHESHTNPHGFSLAWSFRICLELRLFCDRNWDHCGRA